MAQFIQLLEKFGITNYRDFVLTTFCLIIVTIVSAFTQTFINLDCQHISFFRGELLSIDIIMPTIGSIVALFIFPWFAQKTSPKELILLSFIGIIIGLLSINFLIETPVNFVVRFFLGAFYSTLYVCLACLQAKIFPPSHRAVCFSFVGVIIALLTSIGTAMNDWVTNVSYMVGIGVGLSLLGCVISIYLIVPTAPQWKTFHLLKTTKEEGSPKIQTNLTKKENLSFYKVFLEIPYIYLFLFCAGLSYTAILADFPFFGEGLGLSRGDSALLLSIAEMGALIVGPLSGYYGDKFGVQKTLFFISISSFFAITLAFFTLNTYIMSTLFFIVMGSTSSFMGLCISWILQSVARNEISQAMSIFSIMSRLGGIFSPVISGFMMQRLSNQGFLVWLFLIMGSAIGMLFLTVITKRRTIKDK